jgi:threonine dehydrogenase-like Zn-dependent dehydrogenase
LAEYVAMPESNLLSIPEDISDNEAVAVEPVALNY